MATYTVNISGTFNQTYGYLTINGTKITTAGTRTYSSKPTISVYISSSQSNLRSKCEVTINDTVVKSGHGEYTLLTDATTINIVMLQVQDSSTYLYYCADIGIETPKTNEPHNTNIGGTAREFESGTVLIGGVLREIESGLVLVNGVAREIEFVVAPKTRRVTITGNGYYKDYTTKLAYVEIGGKQYTSAASLEVEDGTIATLAAMTGYNTSGDVGGEIKENGVLIGRGGYGRLGTYDYTIESDVTINMSCVYYGNANNNSNIKITTQ